MSESDIQLDVAPVFTGNSKTFAKERWTESQLLSIPVYSGFSKSRIRIHISLQWGMPVLAIVLNQFIGPLLSAIELEATIYISCLLAVTALSHALQLRGVTGVRRCIGDTVVLVFLGFGGYWLLHPIHCPIALHIVGWLTVMSLSQAPLLGIPPVADMACWESPGHSKLSRYITEFSATKAFHVIVVSLAGILTAVSVDVETRSAHLFIFQVILCVLPFGWMLGILPSIEAGVEWAIEQLNYLGFGYSIGSNAFYRSITTFTGTLCAVCCLSGLHYASQFWSTDNSPYRSHAGICFAIGWIFAYRIYPRTNNGSIHVAQVQDGDMNAFGKTVTSSNSTSKIGKSLTPTILMSKWFQFMIILVIMAGASVAFNIPLFGLWDILCWSVAAITLFAIAISLWCIENKLAAGVFKLIGISTTMFLLSLSTQVQNWHVENQTVHTKGYISSFWLTISLTRFGSAAAIRPHSALLGMAIAFLCAPSIAISIQDSGLTWDTINVAGYGALFEFFIDRLFVFIYNTQYVIIYIKTAQTTKKLRVFRYGDWFYKYVLSTIGVLSSLVAAILRSPVVALFGTPLFIPGFPRPARVCASTASSGYEHGKDSAYYHQLLASLALRLKEVVPHPSITPLSMIRFEKLLILVHVLEYSADSMILRLTGLELQETTSCHHVEAGSIDEAIQDKRNVRDSIKSSTFHVMGEIKDVLAYSISKVQLTGVIENKDFLQSVESALWFTLAKFLSTDICEKTAAETATWPISDRNLNISRARDALRAIGKGVIGAYGILGPPGSEMVSDEENDIDAILASLEGVIDNDESNCNNSVANKVPGLPDVLLHSPKETHHVNQFHEHVVDIGNSLDDDDWGIGFGGATTIPATTFSSETTSNDMSKSNITTTREGDISVDNATRVISTIHALLYSEAFGPNSAEEAGPSHVLDCFHGRFPPSIHSEWISSGSAGQERVDSIVQAFRFAFKLALDSMLLGEPDMNDPSTIPAAIQELEQEWHLGGRDERAWNLAVKQQVPHLAALEYNDEDRKYVLYQSSLTKQNGAVIALNPVSVQGTWAGQHLELMYFANSDDERYSIQANTQILRNLLIQSAEPPLGYAVFGSHPLHTSIN